MEEKVLITGKKSPFRFIFIIIPFIIVALSAILKPFDKVDNYALAMILWFSPAFLCIIINIAIAQCNITVTDKRVYGIATFRKRVDLPIDSISVVGTSVMQGIDIATSAGKISFKFMSNNAEIHSVVSKLLISRQGKNHEVNTQIPSGSYTDELKRIKELLDNGVITQEEFEAKKKQLLKL